jgi:DNA-binding transcriptional LysR family regulator
MSTHPSVLFNRLLARGRLRHLQLLVALADSGSVQRAAAIVGMSQPAATQALSDMEGLLGATLFERHRRGVRATPQGQAVIPVARQVMLALRASTETLSALQSNTRALLRLGCIPAAATGLLAKVLPAFLQAHEGLQIELVEENMSQLLAELSAGRLDAVICRQPSELPPNWTFELLMTDEPVVMASPQHPMARRRRIALPELVRYPWILPPPGMRVRDFFDTLWDAQPARPPLYPLVTTSLMVVQEVMRAALAVGMVPKSLISTMVDTGAAVPLAVDLPSASLGGLGLVMRDTPDLPSLDDLRERLRLAGA